MRMIVMEGPEKMVVAERPMPTCRPGYALIKINKVGICGSDVTAYFGHNPTVQYPIEGLGHEAAGEIVEINAAETPFKVGDRVTLEPYIPCRECEMCRQGRFNNCEHLRVAGVHVGGMMADYFEHPVELLHALPDTLSDRDACLIEPFTIGLHAATRGQVKPGETVVIFGAGTIGVLTALGVMQYGATPVLCDVVAARLETAHALGIERVLRSDAPDFLAQLAAVRGGLLPEVMIDCSGAQPVLQNSFAYVAHGGRIVSVGWPHDRVPINQVRMMQKELTWLASRNSNQKFPEATGYIQAGRIPVDQIITHEIPVADLEQTLQDMAQHPERYLKVVVDMRRW